ncbi:MAG TPA: PH domain-containing protein [Frankiaceae bacterium]|jgi:hypothetical protein|nr:PH domain-containing protein [Frankiaceae bacterium]
MEFRLSTATRVLVIAACAPFVAIALVVEPPDAYVPLAILAPMLALAARTWFVRVAAGPDVLLVANYTRTHRIPWDDVADLTRDEDSVWVTRTDGRAHRIAALTTTQQSTTSYRARRDAAYEALERDLRGRT